MSHSEIKANSIILKTIDSQHIYNKYIIRMYPIQSATSDISFNFLIAKYINDNRKNYYLFTTQVRLCLSSIYGIVKIQNKSINLSKKFNIKPKFNKFFLCSVIIGKMHFHAMENFAFYFADKK